MELIGPNKVFACQRRALARRRMARPYRGGRLASRAPFASMAVLLMISSPRMVHGQSPASESEKDPIVLTVLGPGAKRADRIAVHLRRVQIERLLKTFGGSDASRVTREQSRRHLIEEIQKPKGKELV